MKVTIHNLNQATEQEVFDTISAHLLTQKAKSMLHPKKPPFEYEACAYRSREGLMCAIGCLIPLEDYKPEYEKEGWSELLEKYEKLPRRHANFLSRLQTIHDGCDPSDWPSRLRFVAESNLLELNKEFIKLEEGCNKFFNENYNP